MALFHFGKNKQKTEACCSGQEGKTISAGSVRRNLSDVESVRFIVLGACCQRSADTFANVKKAVAELGLSDEVLNIGNSVEIAKYGVMQTPALVIDGKVVSCGRLLKVEEVKKLIEKAGA